MVLEIKTKEKTYPVYIERGILAKAGEIIGKDRRVFVVTDDGVPKEYKDILSAQFPLANWFEFKQGEPSKNLDTYRKILDEMLLCQISRKDCIVALGGGVCGDLAGFAAATYMRGISFINIPTTTLSQIDSAIGGKTGVDLGGVKNVAGAFWQPDAVIIDPEVLKTLPLRHVNNGLVEAVKAGIIRDPELFEIFEKEDFMEHIDEIIERSLLVKKAIVEADETEAGERMVLNFGHTIGHAIETLTGFRERLHGECVALGMMYILDNPELKQRVGSILKKLNQPSCHMENPENILNLIKNDKKADHGRINVVLADEIGKAYIKNIDIEELREKL